MLNDKIWYIPIQIIRVLQYYVIVIVLLIHFAISVTFYLTWNTGLFSLSLQTTETSPTTIVLVGKTNGLCQTRLGRNTRTRGLKISRKWKGISKTLTCLYQLKCRFNYMKLDTFSSLTYKPCHLSYSSLEYKSPQFWIGTLHFRNEYTGRRLFEEMFHTSGSTSSTLLVDLQSSRNNEAQMDHTFRVQLFD